MIATILLTYLKGKPEKQRLDVPLNRELKPTATRMPSLRDVLRRRSAAAEGSPAFQGRDRSDLRHPTVAPRRLIGFSVSSRYCPLVLEKCQNEMSGPICSQKS